jgi:hypothetical protein
MTRKVHDLDHERTEDANFVDPRSYWTNSGHEYLFGADASKRREEVYERDQGICQARGCGRRVSWDAAHMHHRQGGLVGRCWCKHNLEIQCPKCHLVNEHVQVMWTKHDPSV